jgi:hypothetical protein
VYLKRRWVLKTDPRAEALATDAEPTLCPACHMKKNHSVGGYLTVTGEFFLQHREEIETLLRREEERDALTVETTTEHLVERLGRALHGAYKGEIDFGFSHGNKFARAQWSRN